MKPHTSRLAKHRARWLLVGGFVMLAATAAILWRFTPLAEFITPQRLSGWIGAFRHEPWTPFAIIGSFVVGGLVMFPVLLLIAATAVVLDPIMAFFVALAGTLASATATYAIGARFVRGTAQNAFGPALQKVGTALTKSGVIAIALIRIVPVAPFTVVNLAAGSIGVRFRDYLLGTVLGMVPGMIAITALGQQLKAVMDHPTMPRIAAVVGLVLGWIALSLLLQRFVAGRK